MAREVKVLQFGAGNDSFFIAVDSNTEEYLFEVKLYDLPDGLAFNDLADVFKAILARYKSETQDD